MRRLLFVVALMVPLLAASASANLQPHGYVNDFANIIPDDREAVLEQKLRDYEKETSIEMVVVTTPSLDGEAIEIWSIDLATRWGIGKKDVDNGLLFVVAPNEREYRIEVGYGLEGVVPDAVASRLSRNTLPDAFRQGDYAGGIERLMTAFMTTIGHSSAEDRARMLAEQKRIKALQAERQKQQVTQFMRIVVVTLLASILIVGAFLLILRVTVHVKEQRRRSTLRKKVVADVQAREADIAQLNTLHADFDASRLPPWIQSDVAHHRDAIAQGLTALALLKGEIHALTKPNPDGAHEKFKGYVRAVQRVQGHATALNNVDAEVEKFRVHVAKTVHDVSGSVTALTATVRSMVNAGFRVDTVATHAVVDEIARMDDVVVHGLISRRQGVRDTSDEVLRKAEHLKKLVTSVQARLESIRDTKQHVESVLPVLGTRADTVAKDYEATERLLTEICSSAPERVWKDIRQRFDVVPEMLSSVQTLLAQAKDSNSMQTQCFADAGTYVAEAQHLLEQATGIYTSIRKLDTELYEAKQKTPEAMEEAKRVIAKAQSSVADDDANENARSKLTQAKKELEEAQSLLALTPTDWLLVLAGFLAALKLAQSAKKMADEDIAEAERKRRRVEEAEESRRRSYSSSTSSSSSGESSSGGFGGFGGGGFGGGGASGRW